MDYQKLNEHIGHDIVIVSYGKNKESISIECETCNEVIASYDKPLKIKGNTKSKSGLSAIVNMKPKQFIITDPCYIMNDDQYQAICDLGCEFEKQPMPMASSRKEDKKAIVFYAIVSTGGDGSCNYKGQAIGVDAGMLCIAYCKEGWGGENIGATFSTLKSAKTALPKIVEKI